MWRGVGWAGVKGGGKGGRKKVFFPSWGAGDPVVQLEGEWGRGERGRKGRLVSCTQAGGGAPPAQGRKRKKKNSFSVSFSVVRSRGESRQKSSPLSFPFIVAPIRGRLCRTAAETKRKKKKKGKKKKGSAGRFFSIVNTIGG